MNVSLVMVKSDGARREFPLSKNRIVIGRTTSCDLRVPISSVSRQHCELTIESGKISVRDLGSSNGTFHNDTRVQEATLKAGDKIGVGPVTFHLLVDGQPANLIKSAEAPSTKKPAAKAEVVPVQDDEVLAIVEEEEHSPTVDLDDPVAALQALAEVTENPPKKPAAPSKTDPKKSGKTK